MKTRSIVMHLSLLLRTLTRTRVRSTTRMVSFSNLFWGQVAVRRLFKYLSTGAEGVETQIGTGGSIE